MWFTRMPVILKKSHLQNKQLWCIIYLEVIGIGSPIALSSKNDKE